MHPLPPSPKKWPRYATGDVIFETTWIQVTWAVLMFRQNFRIDDRGYSSLPKPNINTSVDTTNPSNFVYEVDPWMYCWIWLDLNRF